MAKTEFQSTVSLKEGLFVEAISRGFAVHMDEPEQLGGTDKAMNPVELLLSALGGCLAITVGAFSKAAHVDIKECKVHVTGDLDPEGFLGLNKEVRKGFSQIRYQIEILSDSPEERIKKLMQMVEERCPVSDTLKGVEVKGDYVLQNQVANK
ncbi:OsmC family protein [Tepidibacillus decaturensis]|uniref:Peroxiredoxin n=1 Tax=Tepidibacillus decaturensis TaxID=1413211 RepID=A0A135L3S2_9BACI|nr:OsmC family protein [Tepidibacillus decaturensis]KXG43600.1 peroxiredoxin [Tepidibacillus decaturensis]